MPPKSRAKRKAEKGGTKSVEVRKQQRGSLQSPQSADTAAALSIASPLVVDRVLEVPSSLTVSASVSTVELAGPSEPPTTLSSVEDLRFEREEASLSFGEDQASVEAIGSELAGPSESLSTASSMEGLRFQGEEASLSLGDDQASVEATESDPTNTLTSQEIMKKFVEEWLQVMAKEDMKSIAIFLCYPKEEGWRHVWIFDHSSCHAAMADDALDVNKMNVRPGGKQRIMHDTLWNEKVWRMYTTASDGTKVAKGLKMVLEERGISTLGKGADWMRKTLAEHADFRNEKNMIERGHTPCFLPKFHPELNPIERVWAQLKRFTKVHCKYTLPSLRKNIPLAYDSVSIENIQNHFRKVQHYMFGYLEGLTPGKELVKG